MAGNPPPSGPRMRNCNSKDNIHHCLTRMIGRNSPPSAREATFRCRGNETPLQPWCQESLVTQMMIKYGSTTQGEGRVSRPSYRVRGRAPMLSSNGYLRGLIGFAGVHGAAQKFCVWTDCGATITEDGPPRLRRRRTTPRPNLEVTTS